MVVLSTSTHFLDDFVANRNFVFIFFLTKYETINGRLL